MIKTNYYDGQQYSAADDRAPWASLLDDGVFDAASNKMIVTANSPADMSVNVAAGACNKSGYYVKSDAVVNVPITANASGYNRIDIIVVDVSANPSVIKAVAGTASSSPAPPLPNVNQLVLAEIAVGNNVSVINSGNVTDKRVMAKTKQEKILDSRTIVEYGGNDTDGYYVKYGNGDVDFWGVIPLNGTFGTGNAASFTKTLPVNCLYPLKGVILTASMYDGASGFQAYRVSAHLNGTNTNNFFGHAFVEYAASAQNYIGVHYEAHGKWK